MTAGEPVVSNRWDELAGRHPDPLPLVSVIVAHFEQPRELERTLLALSRQDYPADRIEIVVVDDGSRARPSVPPGVTLVLQPDEGFRLSAARNAGVRASTGSVLVFLDADTSPEPEYVRLISRLPAVAPDCVTVGRRRHADLADVDLEEPVEIAGPAHELPEPQWLIDGYARSLDLLEADDRSYRYVIGAVMACSRALFEEAGGFDESFTSYGGEDWEWTYRAWRHGAVLAHERRAVAWHDGPDWPGRTGEDGRRLKNAETIRLSTLVAAPGSGPRGIRLSRPDVAVMTTELGEGAEFITVDSALADIPGAAVVGGRYATNDPAAWDEARIRIHFAAGCQVGHGALRDAVDQVAAEALGHLTLIDKAGGALVTVTSSRAAAREERWARPLFPARTREEPRLRRLEADPDVEAYLGGWTRTD